MNKTDTIQARIDPIVKKNAKSVFDRLNLSMSEAISIFLTQVSLERKIPFEIKIPNETTVRTLKNTAERKELHRVKNVDELFEELDK
jgi:DNA-damage-inducible protein J